MDNSIWALNSALSSVLCQTWKKLGRKRDFLSSKSLCNTPICTFALWIDENWKEWKFDCKPLSWIRLGIPLGFERRTLGSKCIRTEKRSSNIFGRRFRPVSDGWDGPDCTGMAWTIRGNNTIRWTGSSTFSSFSGSGVRLRRTEETNRRDVLHQNFIKANWKRRKKSENKKAKSCKRKQDDIRNAGLHSLSPPEFNSMSSQLYAFFWKF